MRCGGRSSVYGCVIVCAILFSAPASEGEMILVASDAHHVRMRCEAGDLIRETVEIRGQRMDVIRLQGAGGVDRVGYPQLPRLGVLLGVPEGVQVRAEVVDRTSVTEAGYHMLPVPRLVDRLYEGETFAEERFDMAPTVYSQDRLWPDKIVEIGEPEYLRDQRVVEVMFYPVQYNPVQGVIVWHKEVVIDVRFEGAAVQRSVLPPSPQRDEEKLYQGSLINYEEARAWRIDRLRVRKASEGSPFSKGQWLKVKVKNEGLYEIRGADLKEAGMNILGVDPRTVRMFYGGGRALPEPVTAPRRTHMEEIAIWVQDGGDGRFDESDALLFYGQSMQGWAYDAPHQRFVHYQNPYTDENCYWLTFEEAAAGKRMEARNGAPRDSGPFRPETFRARIHEEVERFPFYEEFERFPFLRNLGRAWYWEAYRGSSKRYSSLMYGASGTEPVKIRIRALGNILEPSQIRVSFNDQSLGLFHLDDVRSEWIEMEYHGPVNDGMNTLGIEQIDSEELLFDWYEVDYARRFEGHRGELFFTSLDTSRSSPSGGLWEYRIGGFDPDAEVLDVTDPFAVKRIIGVNYEADSGTMVFQDSLRWGVPRYYYVGSPSRRLRPERMVLDRPSHLRSEGMGADYVILTHRDFYEEAMALRQWREEDDRFGPPLRTAVVDVEDVYDEFAWGLFDPTAIRDFLKYAFEHWTPRPYLVLLFGDGVYDYKDHSGTHSKNWIPPYEEPLQGYAIDDWFVYMDSGYLPDMAIGRLPVRTKEEAQVAVDKIIQYEKNPLRGNWQNTALLVGDDELVKGGKGNEIDYTVDTERLSSHAIPQRFDQVKVFLMEYPLNAFNKKPEAKAEVIRRINEGALLFNYVGHGNYDVLAHEDVLRASTDIPLLKNGRRLPFFFSASCSNAHFDDPVKVSLAERLFIHPEGGVIACVAATRNSLNAGNVDLNLKFYKNLFQEKGSTERLGIALMKAKVQTFARGNAQVYILVGDPAMRLQMPRATVRLENADTLRALDELQVAGTVYHNDGVAAEFNGKVYLKVMDSAQMITRTTYGRSSVRYTLPGNPLFRGIFPVQGGRFETTVRIPKGISYGGRLGRISVFVWNDQEDGAGAMDSLYVGGTSAAAVEDETGPSIHIGFEGQDFEDGDFIPAAPVLVAHLEDESGINVTGEIGHAIEVWVDGREGMVYRITESFVADGSYRKGTATYPLDPLSEGMHTVAVKAWDNLNNSSVTEVTVRVAGEEGLAIEDVLCYPNPMSSYTMFVYQLSRPAAVRIRVYTLAGRLVGVIEAEGKQGYNETSWNAEEALANGLYLFSVTARGEGGAHAEVVERLAVVR